MRSHFPIGYAVSIAAGLAVAACSSESPSDSPPSEPTPETVIVSSAGEALTLGNSTPERLSGHYMRDGVNISFDSVRTASLFRFEVRTSDGRTLIRGEKSGKNRFVTRVLDRRLEVFYDLAATSDNVTFEGDETAMADAEKTPEYGVLPWLSHALGNHGFNGRDYPSVLALHMFNKGAAQKLNIELPLAHSVQLPAVEVEKGYCTAYPNSNNDCYGMCGRGCSCWSFVCGDCCYHNGCATHDSYCRGSGFWDTARCWTTWGAAFFGC